MAKPCSNAFIRYGQAILHEQRGHLMAIFESSYTEQLGIVGLIRELFSRVSELVRTQIELTKAEVKVEGRKLIMAGLFGLIALTIGSIFLILLAVSLLLFLADYLQLIWATVITTAIFLVLTVIFSWLTIWEIKRNSAYIDI
jgi:uncharacterized membrane protein YqjE